MEVACIITKTHETNLQSADNEQHYHVANGIPDAALHEYGISRLAHDRMRVHVLTCAA